MFEVCVLYAVDDINQLHYAALLYIGSNEHIGNNATFYMSSMAYFVQIRRHVTDLLQK